MQKADGMPREGSSVLLRNEGGRRRKGLKRMRLGRCALTTPAEAAVLGPLPHSHSPNG